jgi:hypothetical protein
MDWRTDLDDVESNLLIRRHSGKSLDQEWCQILNILVPKRSNCLRLAGAGGQLSQDPSAILDHDPTKDPSHCIWRYCNGVGCLKRPIGNPFYIHRSAFGFMDC